MKCTDFQENTPVSTKLSIIVVLLMLSLLLFSCCYAGKLMDDVVRNWNFKYFLCTFKIYKISGG